MKWLFVLLLALVVFGGAAFFSYDLFVKPEQQMRAERTSETTTEPTPDISLPEFQTAARLRQEDKLPEARAALTAFIQKYPSGLHAEEAKDLLGEVNVKILLSAIPSPDKQEYTVKSGDVLARVANKMKSTPELIMKMNGLNGTMLHIGERLFVSHPDFALIIQRQAQSVILLNHGMFFKRYHIRTLKLPPKQPAKLVTKVSETMAFFNGKRVGFGSKEFSRSTRWIRLAAPGCILYSESEPGIVAMPPPPTGIGLAAAELEELSSLVNSKSAVTIID